MMMEALISLTVMGMLVARAVSILEHEMVCYNSHELLLVLLTFLSRSSVQEDITCPFSPRK